ncbi:MAG: multicopper oxidase domain-containing protein [Motiliproteus sp.]
MKKSLATLVGAIALTLTAGASAADYVENYAEIVKAADWKAMTTLTVNMEEFEYDTDLEFNAGQTYKLEIKNLGEKKHYFTAPEFFKNIATRKAQVNGQAEIKAPYFDALEILPGGQLDLYFVAHNKGEYAVYCTIDDHRDEGMEETIIIK